MGGKISKRISDVEETVPLCSASPEHEPLSQQCVDDPVPLNPVVVYEDKEFHITNQPPMTGFVPEGETHSEDYDPLMTSSAEQEEEMDEVSSCLKLHFCFG